MDPILGHGWLPSLGLLPMFSPPPTFDTAMARRMAAASDVAYYIDEPGGVKSAPYYADVGFRSLPTSIVQQTIDAALVGTTATEVVVAFRGTLPIGSNSWQEFAASLRDWTTDAQLRLVTASYTTGEVHRGFRDALESVWRDVLVAVRHQAAASGLPVIVTGHSKGGAMARLAALRLLAEAGITPVGVYTFGAPRTGNIAFGQDYASKIRRDWRFENQDDLVPHLPPTAAAVDVLAAMMIDSRLLNQITRAYQHVGLLEFLGWLGGIVEGDSFLLHSERTLHLAELFAAGDSDRIAADHSLENAYLPRLQ
jgi:hypothetical protein